jgi:hypothetical protein
MFKFINPILRVVFVEFLIPDECAFNVRLWGHWTETQARITANDALFQFILWAPIDESRRENEPHRHEESCQNGVENQVEEQNFACKS